VRKLPNALPRHIGTTYMPSMLLQSLVYARTQRGRDEIAKPLHALHTATRRLLFMVDGERCTAELSGMVRGGELQFLLFELLVLDLIQPAHSLPIGDARTFSGDMSLTREGESHFQTVRGRLVLKLFDALGERASSIIERVATAANPIELVDHIRPLKKALQHGRTAADVERFLQKIARVMIDGAPERAPDNRQRAVAG
jgi:hypothetical protein